MRIHRAVVTAVLAALCLLVVLAAIDEDRIAKARPSAAPSSSPSPETTPSGDCCAEAVQTNYPVPPLSDRGNHCPSDHVPAGSSNVFDPESGRLEIDFYDVGYGHSRSFVLDLRDPACFEHAATRQALFIELVVYLQATTADGEWSTACDVLRDAIQKGSLTLGERPFNLRIARPYANEVCAANA